jgi:hypothetical protein
MPWDAYPLWHLSVRLPQGMAFWGLKLGDTDVAGVRVAPRNELIVTGRYKDWCNQQVARFVRGIAPDWIGRVEVLAEREATPVLRAERHSYFVEISPRECSVKSGNSSRVLAL